MIRVFPRRTKATPVDLLVFCDGPPFWRLEGGVSVSCAFTYDKPRAEVLAEQWSKDGYDVSIGGPAYDDPGGEFEPGLYVKMGKVITSRGCNNDCWFCTVPTREGEIRELEIKDGYDLLDNNLLQCSHKHIRGVFEMLNRQPQAAKLTGGLEAAMLKDWHVDLIAGLKPKPEILYFAYDMPDDLEPLREAAKKMRAIGFDNQRVGCYVLMGWPKDAVEMGRAEDTIEDAQRRLQTCVDLDMMPFAMLYDGHKKYLDPAWKDLQQAHIRAARTRSVYKGQFGAFFKEREKMKKCLIVIMGLFLMGCQGFNWSRAAQVYSQQQQNIAYQQNYQNQQNADAINQRLHQQGQRAYDQYQRQNSEQERYYRRLNNQTMYGDVNF